MELKEAKILRRGGKNTQQNYTKKFFLAFCHRGAVICISEVIDISPSKLDSSCASSSPAFLMMYSAYKLNKQGDNIEP